MKKVIYSLPFILGICCFIAFNMIGSKVEADGTLVEPFFLIPMAYLFFFSGILLLIVRGGWNLYRKYVRA
ncbi:DUF3955 domain-containing protein [Clostridium mediterraneense]|uniref:DUF3955 domain-containing protein n=1 Tax=Clostridium mediterraneense TaxID=1805472 RepID=UPI000832BF2F|nr:DUF3955 domain-containing protein [Clostridium mediterraneense]